MEPSVWMRSMATHASAPRVSGTVEEHLRGKVSRSGWKAEAGEHLRGKVAWSRWKAEAGEQLRRKVVWSRWKAEAGLQASLQLARAARCRSWA